MVAAFAALNLLVLVIAAPGGHQEKDTGNYYAVARGLLQHGDFVNVDEPSKFVRIAPGYPLLLSVAHVVGRGDATIPIILIQVLALLVTGLITRHVVSTWLGGFHNLAMALVVFNPNSLGIAHTLMPMTLYALALTASVWAGLEFARSPRMGHAVLAGLFLGLAVLFRFDPRFLIVLLPLALPLLAISAGQRMLSWRVLSGGFVAAALAAATITPWTLYADRSGPGFGVAGSATGELFLAANLGILEKRLNPNLTPGFATIAAIERGIDDPVLHYREDETYEGFIGRSGVPQNFFEIVSSYPRTVVLKSLAFSHLNLFVSGGAGNIRRLFGIVGNESQDNYFWGGHGNRLSAWLGAFAANSPQSAAISVGAIVFATTMRLFGLFGLAALVTRRRWPLLIAIVTVLLYSTVIVIFNGLSRYRVPIEPLLIILSVYGFDAIQSWRNRHRGLDGPKTSLH